MAQRTEKEETEFKVVLETLPTPTPTSSSSTTTTTTTTTTLCSNNCSDNNKATSGSILKRSARSMNLKSTQQQQQQQATSSNKMVAIRNKEIDAVKKRDQTIVNRCSGCKKKVGLTGFRCRCGELFCAQHRYSDRHDCSYDYKSAGREAIARENPVVKAAKMVKV